MNPYDFVRLDPGARVERKPFCPLNRYGANAWITGRMEGTIEALRPIFLPKPSSGTPKQFLRSDARHAAIIPGSSLKGLFRSLVETVAPGCWWLFQGTYKDKNNVVDYSDKLPRQYQHCSDIERLCPACRLFGMLGNPGALLGKVAFEDAVCYDERPHPAGFTPPLAGPKPHHSAWYLSGDHVVGRKFYFHHEQPEFSSTRPAGAMQMVQNLQPLGAGSQFRFDVSFENVAEQDEWPLLIFALVLEPGMRHKLGYAKSAGLGSVEVRVSKIEFVDPRARYRGAANGGRTILEGESLTQHLAHQAAACAARAPALTLDDLRRIWAWPPASGVRYRYPPQDWFAEHSQLPISQT